MSIIVTGGAGMIGSNIIEGLNKSGHIAEKCAATFSSLGIPSFYVHANEAFHGDFGMMSGKPAWPKSVSSIFWFFIVHILAT